MDSNHRTRKRTDLQSAAFGHFANPPYSCYARSGNRQTWWLGTESNRRHEDFQSSALPTELPSHKMLSLNIQLHEMVKKKESGGADGIRTRGLLRDRQAC